MPAPASRMTYRWIPAMPRLQPPRHAARAPHHMGLLRLSSTPLRRAVTLLINWDRAVGDGWPRLQPPSLPLWRFRPFKRPAARRYAGFPWCHGRTD
ncbi:hypothetical protein MKD50_05000 [Cupriavidus sp. WGtm5]|uniref:hypothetical protein n=1 Tax=Cupriavidus TaxID=106589 RepID=UPI000E18F85C|nr:MULTISPECIES: hypothetical protein [Cupriavidus]MCO4888727.1 hypothetical protein [Cupriavidus sp. WGtm5]ULX54798.1 hypothetical protein A9P79_23345 [Cupriavidus taiwanensis]SPA38040.1 conserved hypothetical protein [Cupriavidus taiwanensis]